ncbi:ACP S-malonyltransferase [Clostridium botulinum]|nr:ACP S-malonyltransferase [Clostridium botulinum]
MNKVALLFPGQGSQYVGMGKELYDKFDKAKEIFNTANEVLGFDLKKLCFEGDSEELTKTENTQPALLTVSYAAFNAFKEIFELEPEFLAGHSLGEYSALLCSEVINFSDALQIVRKRGEFMREAAEDGLGCMFAVRDLNKKFIEQICNDISNNDEVVVVSNYNSPSQTIISGHKSAAEKAVRKLEDMSIQTTKLNVSAAFHSPLMQGVSKKLRNELMKYRYNDFKYPVISNVYAKPYENSKTIITTLTEQLIKPVKWADTIKYLESKDINIAIEIGSKNVLRNLVTSNSNKMAAYSIDNKEDIRLLEDDLKGRNNITKSNLNVVTRCLAIAVCTRNRNWNNEEYTKGVIEPYKKLQIMQEKIDDTGKMLSVEEMKESLELLKTIFKTKKVSKEEQEARFEQIFSETGTKNIFADSNRNIESFS